MMQMNSSWFTSKLTSSMALTSEPFLKILTMFLTLRMGWCSIELDSEPLDAPQEPPPDEPLQEDDYAGHYEEEEDHQRDVAEDIGCVVEKVPQAREDRMARTVPLSWTYSE